MEIPGLMERAERAEAELFYHFISMAPAEVKARLGISTARLDGAVITSVRNDVTGYWTDALGLGLDQPVTSDLVDQVLDFFIAEHNPAALLHVAPGLVPAGWTAIVDRHGLLCSQARYQHACRIEDVRPAGSTNFRIGPPSDLRRWTRFTMHGLGMPDPDLAEMLVPGYGSDSVQLFAAWDDSQMVAGASLFIWEDVAVLNSGTTLPSHRNRGAQSALIAARVAAATDAGCRWVVAQTAKPVAGEFNPSTKNMIRAGLPVLYARPIWTWTRDLSTPKGSI
jgi:hypothetical protein